MPAGGQEALAKQVLVVIENEPPLHALDDDRTKRRVAQGTIHDLSSTFSSCSQRALPNSAALVSRMLWRPNYAILTPS